MKDNRKQHTVWLEPAAWDMVEKHYRGDNCSRKYEYQNYKRPNLRPNTQMSYERRIYQHIIPNLGGIRLDKLTTNDIQQFHADLKQNGRLLRSSFRIL